MEIYLSYPNHIKKGHEPSQDFGKKSVILLKPPSVSHGPM